MSSIKIKRIYEAPDKSDGYRILVDRLWPRGIKRNMLTLMNGVKMLRHHQS